ncbi:MAG: hypothetical protein JSW00_15905 [Thermoplasmata archaeon]|nr:MAG: hypothetical protein JSW00_15905 [Thermoplasmata archaeon]
MSRKKKLQNLVVWTLVFSLFIQLTLFFEDSQIMVSAGEPDIIDNGDYTMSAIWDFDDITKFNLDNLTMKPGSVDLTLDTFWWNQTTYEDFSSGINISTNLTLSGDITLAEEMKGVNLIQTGDFSSSLDWDFKSGANITSSYNGKRENARLSYSYFTGPNTAYLVPVVGEDDGIARGWQGIGNWIIDDTSSFTSVGLIWEGLYWVNERSFFYFNLNSIPKKATIDNVVFYARIQKDSDDTDHLIDIVSLEQERADHDTPRSLFDDCGDGTIYVNDSDSLKKDAPNVYHEWDLNAAKSDLKDNLLNKGWFGIGIYEEGNNSDRALLKSVETDVPPTPTPPQLNVSYTVTGPVTFDDTAYINQTFYKPNVTPNTAEAVNLSFDYNIEKFQNCTAELSVIIDGNTVWNYPIFDTTSEKIYVNAGQIMTEARNYDISLQLHMDVLSATSVECVAEFDNVTITTLGYSDFGTYTSQIYETGSEVFWDEISWNYYLPVDTDLTIRTRSSMDNSTWSDWSYEYTNSDGEQIAHSIGKFIQVEVNLSTTNYTKTPFLFTINISYSKHPVKGTIEMKDDLVENNVRDWGTFKWDDQLNGQNISHEYSTDGGNFWSQVPFNGDMSTADIVPGKIRLRAHFTTEDTTKTPSLQKWNLTYKVSALANLFDKLDPEWGYRNEWYNFSVRYTDPDNDPPASLTLNITNGTSYVGNWDMLPYELNESDLDYTDGKWYYFNRTGFKRGTNYTFHFAAEDPFGTWTESESRNRPLILNSEPKILTSNVLGADEGEPYIVDYEAEDLEDLENLTWSLETNTSSWLEIGPVNGTLYGTPPGGTRGEFWINITVSDGYGGFANTNFTLIVGDRIPPVADAGKDGVAYEDVPYFFDGTNSSDNSGVLYYTWLFEEDSIGYEGKPTYTFTQKGHYKVILIVKDPLNNDDMDYVNITVYNTPPTAVAGGDKIVDEGQTVQFDGSNSDDTVSDIETLIYLWDFDNDTIFDDGVGENPTYTWYDEEILTASLKVIDDSGDFDTDNFTVEVQNVDPSVNLEKESYTVEKGTEVILIAYASDPGLDSLEFRWDWENDGTYDTDWSSEWVVRHAWPTVGTYTLKVQVRDNDGGFGIDTASMDITKRKVPPVIKNLGTRKVRYATPYEIDLTTYITDDDTPLSELNISTDDEQHISVSGLKIYLNYPIEMVNQVATPEIFVTDGTFIDSEILTVDITTNYPPRLIDTAADVEFYEDGELTDVFNLNDKFDDEDGDPLSFEIFSDDPNIIITIDSNGMVSFSAKRDWAGNGTVRFLARDPSGAFAELGLFVTVVPVNDPPMIINQLGFTTLDKGENWTINLAKYFYDVDSEDLIFTCNKPEIIIDQLNLTATWVPGTKKELTGVVITADDGEHTVSLDPIDIKVYEPEPFNWFLVILPFILGLLVFAVYRELRYRYNIEEVFLVDNAGVLLVHLSRGESKAIDAKLVSGMLTAVQEFVKDSFMGNEDLEDIKLDEGALGKLEYGDFQIVIERGEFTFLSAVISGYDNKRLRKRMKDVVTRFEAEYSDVLADWDGDMAKFEGGEIIVGKLLKQPSAGEEIPDETIDEEEAETGEDINNIEEELPHDDFGEVPSYYEETDDAKKPPPG